MRKLVEKYIQSWVRRHNMYAVVTHSDIENCDVVYQVCLTKDDTERASKDIQDHFGRTAKIIPIHFNQKFKY